MSEKTPGQRINELKPDEFVTLYKVGPSGSLEARRGVAGVVFKWRFTYEGKTRREPIGSYDPSAPPKSYAPTDRGYSVQAALRVAERMAHKHKSNLSNGGYAALLEVEAEAKRAAEQAVADEAARQLAEQKYTLKSLLVAYCDHLKNEGKSAHSAARNIFKNHVFDAWPEVACLPAKSVSGEQIGDMMRRVHQQGHGRTSNKLRSYLHSAYGVARASKSNPAVPIHFKSYQIGSNPVADTTPDSRQNKADKRPLSADELKKYWRKIEKLPGIQGRVLRFHLLTGGQRIEQLMTLKNENIHPDHIVIFDKKGRPGTPERPHYVPLVPAARAELNQCSLDGEFTFSLRAGKTHIASNTFSRWAADAVGGAIADFKAKRLRSGVETLLASAKVGKELRGRLQSHGISGVQDKHYDGHDYIDEVREILEVLYKKLTAKP